MAGTSTASTWTIVEKDHGEEPAPDGGVDGSSGAMVDDGTSPPWFLHHQHWFEDKDGSVYLRFTPPDQPACYKKAGLAKDWSCTWKYNGPRISWAKINDQEAAECGLPPLPRMHAASSSGQGP